MIGGRCERSPAKWTLSDYAPLDARNITMLVMCWAWMQKEAYVETGNGAVIAGFI